MTPFEKPSDAGTGEPTPGALELPDHATLRASHEKLMASYFILLQDASRIRVGSLTPNRGAPGSFEGRLRGVYDNLVGRYVTSFLIVRHIRTRLADLSKAYEQLRSLVVSDEDLQVWLKTTNDKCTRVISTLPTLRLPSAIAVLPIAIGLAVDVRHAHLRVHRPDLLAIFLIFYVGLYLTLPLSLAFNEKRQYFLALSSPSEPRSSTYAREREHFAVLNRGRFREIQLDIMLPILLLVLLAGTFLVAGVLPSSVNYLYVGISVVFYVLAVVLGMRLKRDRLASLRAAVLGEEAAPDPYA